jgi:hypothetical protein
MSIDKFKLGSSWTETKERLKENNIDLTDDDLKYEPGKENELLERLQKKMKKTKEEINMLIESISHNKSQAS